MIILYLLFVQQIKTLKMSRITKERAYETYQKDEHQEQSVIEDKVSVHKNYPEEVQRILLISRHSVPCRELPKTSIDSFSSSLKRVQTPPLGCK